MKTAFNFLEINFILLTIVFNIDPGSNQRNTDDQKDVD